MEKATLFLYVDDDGDDRYAFQTALNEVNPTIKLVLLVDGTELISFLVNNPIKEPNIIFLDIDMPIMDGWECLHLIKNDIRFKSIPVIIYSTSESKRFIDRAFSLGAFCYCVKPDSYADLKNLLRIIDKHLFNDLHRALNDCKECKTVYFTDSERYNNLMD